MDTRTVERSGLRGDRPEKGVCWQNREAAYVDLNPTRQRGRCLHHALRVAKENVGLIPRHRRRVDFRALLTVGEEAVQANAGRKRRLAIPFGALDISLAKAPAAVGAEPAEQRADDELLPGLELERLPRVRALCQAQEAGKELHHPLRPALIESQPALRTALEVPEMTLTGQPYQAIRHNPAAYHGLSIGRDGTPRWRANCHAGTPSAGRPAAPSPRGPACGLPETCRTRPAPA